MDDRRLTQRPKNVLHRRGKIMKQTLLEMVQVNITIFFYFDEIGKMKHLQSQKPRFLPILQIMSKIACLPPSIFRFHPNKKKLEQ